MVRIPPQHLEYADRCIVLDGGRVIHDTPDVLAAVLAYEKGMMSQAQTREVEPLPDSGRDARRMTVSELKAIQEREWNQELGEKRFGSARAIIERIDLYKGDGASLEKNPLLKPNEEVVFRFSLLAAEAIQMWLWASRFPGRAAISGATIISTPTSL